MKVLVTGANGFCGRHLAKYLSGQGVQMCSISSKEMPGESHVLEDINDEAHLTSIIESAKPDFVFHLAGVMMADSASQFYKVNTMYAVSLLTALEMAGYANAPVLLVGSAAEYGEVEPGDLPITEDRIANPYNHYGTSKLMQTIIGQVESGNGRKIVVVRPFNLIGSGMPEHLSIPCFVNRLIRIKAGLEEPVLKVGTLDSTRDFIDVNDAIKIYWKLIRTASAYGQVVNVCSGVGTSLRVVTNKIINFASMKVNIQQSPELTKSVEIPEHFGSARKMRKLTGLSNTIDLDTSIKGIIEKSGLI